MKTPDLVKLALDLDKQGADLATNPNLRAKVPAERCTRVKKNGEQCKRQAVKGTVPPMCTTHGALLPSVRAKANERVSETIREQLEGLLPAAVERLGTILRDPVDDKVALQAARDVLDRTGHGAVNKVEVGGPGSFDEVDSKIDAILNTAAPREAKDDT